MAKRKTEPGITLHRTWVNKDIRQSKLFNADYFAEVMTWLSSPIYYMVPEQQGNYKALEQQTENFYNTVLPTL